MKDAHKHLKEKENITNPVTDTGMELGEHDRTLSDILSDKKTQDTFLNSFCYEQDVELSKEIATSLADGIIMTPEQSKFLEKMRNDFNMRTVEAQKVQEILPDMIGRLAENDPRIQQIVGKIGGDRAAELLGKEFGTLALSDTKQFKKIVRQLRELHDLETNPLIAHLERNVQSALFKYGISEEKYWEASRGGLTAGTKSELDKAAYEQLDFFRKAIDFATGGSISHRRGRELYINFGDQTAVIQDADKHMKAIGKVLQGTLNSDVNLAIQKAMLEGGDVHEHKIENNLSTITDYNAAKKEFHTMQPRWETYRDSEAKK